MALWLSGLGGYLRFTIPRGWPTGPNLYFHGSGSWFWFMVLVHGFGSWFWFMVLVHGFGSWFWFMVLVHDFDMKLGKNLNLHDLVI
jgi:hypothetical protein